MSARTVTDVLTQRPRSPQRTQRRDCVRHDARRAPRVRVRQPSAGRRQVGEIRKHERVPIQWRSCFRISPTCPPREARRANGGVPPDAVASRGFLGDLCVLCVKSCVTGVR
jgi:hypothetical protein